MDLTESDEPAATWTRAAPRFSTYTHAEAWDSAHFASSHLTAVDDVPFRDQDLAVLREQFAVSPRTYGWAGNFGVPA